MVCFCFKEESFLLRRNGLKKVRQFSALDNYNIHPFICHEAHKKLAQLEFLQFCILPGTVPKLA